MGEKWKGKEGKGRVRKKEEVLVNQEDEFQKEEKELEK